MKAFIKVIFDTADSVIERGFCLESGVKRNRCWTAFAIKPITVFLVILFNALRMALWLTLAWFSIHSNLGGLTYLFVFFRVLSGVWFFWFGVGLGFFVCFVLWFFCVCCSFFLKKKRKEPSEKMPVVCFQIFRVIFVVVPSWIWSIR